MFNPVGVWILRFPLFSIGWHLWLLTFNPLWGWYINAKPNTFHQNQSQILSIAFYTHP